MNFSERELTLTLTLISHIRCIGHTTCTGSSKRSVNGGASWAKREEETQFHFLMSLNLSFSKISKARKTRGKSSDVKLQMSVQDCKFLKPASSS